MAVTYREMTFASRDREHVSRQWYVLLYDLYHLDGVRFNVNEGHRTMARQEQLVRELGVWSWSNPHGAAVPSANAPHIRSGRPDHALDFDNAEGVRRAAAKRGVTLTRTVPTEEWHLEANAAQLAHYYEANKARVLGIGCRELRPGSRAGRDVYEVQRMLRRLGYLHADHKLGTAYGKPCQRAVKSFKSAHHLPHDSILGPRAYKALTAAYRKATR